MKTRQLFGGAAFSPDVLKILFEAFDEVSPEISSRPAAVEAARVSLASIVLRLAKSDPIDRVQIKTAAVDAFRRKHRLAQP